MPFGNLLQAFEGLIILAAQNLHGNYELPGSLLTRRPTFLGSGILQMRLK
jgi:hypothetical protein